MIEERFVCIYVCICTSFVVCMPFNGTTRRSFLFFQFISFDCFLSLFYFYFYSSFFGKRSTNKPIKLSTSLPFSCLYHSFLSYSIYLKIRNDLRNSLSIFCFVFWSDQSRSTIVLEACSSECM